MMTRLFKEIIRYFVSDLCLLNYYKKKAQTQQPTLELSTEIINIFLQAADDDNVSNVVMYLVKVSHYQSLLPDGFQITIHPSAPRQRNVSTSRDGFYVS